MTLFIIQRVPGLNTTATGTKTKWCQSASEQGRRSENKLLTTILVIRRQSVQQISSDIAKTKTTTTNTTCHLANTVRPLKWTQSTEPKQGISLSCLILTSSTTEFLKEGTLLQKYYYFNTTNILLW